MALTFKEFKEKLEGGQYDGTTGARRAAGKAKIWTDAEREKAQALITQHFGDEPAKKKAARTTKKATTKKVRASSKKAVHVTPTRRKKKAGRRAAETLAVEAAPKKRRGRPPKNPVVETVAEAAPKKRRGRPPKNKPIEPTASSASAATEPKKRRGRAAGQQTKQLPLIGQHVDATQARALHTVGIVGTVITSLSDAIRAMEKVREISNNKVDVQEGLKAAQSALSGAARKMNDEVIVALNATPPGIPDAPVVPTNGSTPATSLSEAAAAAVAAATSMPGLPAAD